jgi:hypothetical protein
MSAGALLVVLAAFPVELDAGFRVPIEGRLPRLLVVDRTPALVWVDPRRRWLEGRTDAGEVYLVDLPDGGAATTSGAPLSNDSLAPGPQTAEGLAVAGAAGGVALVVWESRDLSGQFLPRFVIRTGDGGVVNGAGPSSAQPVRPVAAAWTGNLGLVSWPLEDGGQDLRWVDELGGFGQRATLRVDDLLSMGVMPDGGVLLAFESPSGWVSGVLWRGDITLRTPAPATNVVSHLTVEPRGSAIVTHQSTFTTLAPRPTGAVRMLQGTGVLLEAPSLTQLQPSGDFVVARTFPTGGEVRRTSSAGMEPFAPLQARSLTVAALGDSALVVSESPVTGSLERRQFRLVLSAPGPVALIEAMRRSPRVAWGGDRWVLAWEEGSSIDPGTRLVSILPDSSVVPLTVTRPGWSAPRLAALEDGGLALSTLQVGVTTNTLAAAPLTVLGTTFLTASGTNSVTTKPGLLHFSPTQWWWWGNGSSPSGMFDGRATDAVSGLAGQAWFVIRDIDGWKVQFLDPVTGSTTFSSTVRTFSAPPLAPKQAVISLRRSTTGVPVALVGVRDGSQVAWAVVSSDGGVRDAGVTSASVRGIAVTEVGSRWLRASVVFSSGVGTVSSALVSDDGSPELLPLSSLGPGEPGLPELAPGRPGEVGVAVPVLVDDEPRLKFTVLRFDAGLVPMEIDGGAIIDAGPPMQIDAGTSDDGGHVLDAGVEMDAGLEVDAGTLADAGPTPDGGAVDTGVSTEPVVFSPVACSCTQGGSLWASLWGLLLAGLARRRR